MTDTHDRDLNATLASLGKRPRGSVGPLAGLRAYAWIGRGLEKTGRWLLLLHGACYFGPTKSLFLMDLRSDESDKASRSDLFT